LPSRPSFSTFMGRSISLSLLLSFESIKKHAVRFGICRVVPPEGWANPNQVDFNSKKKFATKLQRMSLMQVLFLHFPSVLFAENSVNNNTTITAFDRRGGRWVTVSFMTTSNTKRWRLNSAKLGMRPCVCLSGALFFRLNEHASRIESHYAEPEKVTYRDLEEDYWRLIKNTSGEMVEVEYGNDLSTHEYSSGFPLRQVSPSLNQDIE
jgi:hypothetical protein